MGIPGSGREIQPKSETAFFSCGNLLWAADSAKASYRRDEFNPRG
jgi:hypothetical protein